MERQLEEAAERRRRQPHAGGLSGGLAGLQEPSDAPGRGGEGGGRRPEPEPEPEPDWSAVPRESMPVEP